MTRLLSSLAILSLFATTGCQFYFGDDDCDDYYGGGDMYYEEYRDPYTGQCEPFGGGGDCSDPCSPCYGAYDREAMAMPSWAVCNGYCEALGEDECLATTGCRGAYVDDCLGADCGVDTNTFYGCWGTDQTGPIQGGGCSGLDAWECSRHDDCIAVHSNNGCAVGESDIECDPLGAFQQCLDEAVGCYDYDDSMCPEDTYCNATEICLPMPGCEDSADEAPGFVDCEEVCYGFCVPGDPPPPPVTGTCDDALCDMVAPACPDGTVPGVADGCYTGYCIPATDCEAPGDPGTCWDEPLCFCEVPECPEGTVPGIIDACYSGYCIPESECEEPPVPCASITDEDQCIDRFDCAPFYEGINCTCDEDGNNCVCEEWIFDSCATDPDAGAGANYRCR